MSTIHLPHETVPADRIFTCWPADSGLWLDDLEPAQREFAAFMRAVTRPHQGRRQALTILAATPQAEASAQAAMGSGANILRAPYGDVWARDTGPVFYRQGSRLMAARFRFNGWGGKYQLPGDDGVAAYLAGLAGAQVCDIDLTAEGGALEFDGDGTLITTRQCLLNANRNPGMSEQQVEERLKAAFGLEKVLWIEEGLIGDHTDGHIDNIVRFVSPGVVVCQAPSGADDPQAAVLNAIARQLARMTDAKGRRLIVHRIPSPGKMLDEDGEPMAASHLNYVVAPAGLIVPVYGSQSQARALAALRRLFKRPVTGVRANAILTGGGAFHCVTCHVPGGWECSDRS